MKTDIEYMKIAYKEAEKANSIDEIPVGAIIVDSNGTIIGKGYNKREKENNTLGHAEVEAIMKANKKIKNWRLVDSTLYVTLEPCEMCKKIISAARIKKVVYCLKNNDIYNNESEYEELEDQDIKNRYKNLFISSFKKIR